MLRRITRLGLASAIIAGSLACGGVALAASLGFSSKKLHAWSQTLTKGSCNPAESDAEIDQSSPNTNFGNRSAQKVLSSSGGNSYVLIRFNATGSPCSLNARAGADGAVLTLTVTSTSNGPDTVSAYPITSAWTAGTVTWNTMPTYSATPDFSLSGAGTYTFTVTAAIDAGIKAGSNAFYGWMFIDTTGTNNATTTIAGRGSAQAPSIALNYEQ
jgi:hypothetical protein